MDNIEYTKMAYLYDKFYSKKNYVREVDFIKNFIDSKDDKILDAGCGTGNHAKILSDAGYSVFGFDQSSDMVDIANSKIKDHFYVDNLISLKQDTIKNYGLIISFFAVFNHLKNYNQFEIALHNLKKMLKQNGKIIIDLHNPIKSGSKTETIDNVTRVMTWKKCILLKKEFTKISYTVNNKTFFAKHTFKIFNINKLRRLALSIGFKNIEFYENYDLNSVANKYSKNIQMVVSV